VDEALSRGSREKLQGIKRILKPPYHTLGTTPAVAAGLEEKPWNLEKVVEMTRAHWQKKAAVSDLQNKEVFFIL